MLADIFWSLCIQLEQEEGETRVQYHKNMVELIKKLLVGGLRQAVVVNPLTFFSVGIFGAFCTIGKREIRV